MAKKNKKLKEIKDYDVFETTEMIRANKPLRFSDLGLELPHSPPTQVISIRLPTELLNQIRAIGSEQDVPYQALIKMLLNEGVRRTKKKSA